MLVLVALSAVGFAVFRPTGTRTIDVKRGSGPAVTAGDKVVVHYVGRLINGTTFDSSKGRPPFELDVGKGEIIKGWEVGLIGMRAGGVRQLIIPPKEAYGERGVPP